MGRSQHVLRAVSLFAGLLLAAATRAAGPAEPPAPPATDFHSPAYGYRLTVPAGWARVPPDVLRATAGAMQKPDAKNPPIYDAGFEPAGRAGPLRYPYALVQVIPYANLGSGRQPNDREFDQAVRSLTGFDPKQAFEQNASDEAKGLLAGGAKLGMPDVDRANRRYRLAIDLDVTGIGPVRGLTVGQFGREALVQVLFYAKADEWPAHAATAEALVRSFRFDPAKAYDESAAGTGPGLGGIDWSTVGQKALVGGVVGGLSVLIGFAVRKLGKKKPAGGPPPLP